MIANCFKCPKFLHVSYEMEHISVYFKPLNHSISIHFLMHLILINFHNLINDKWEVASNNLLTSLPYMT
jgi:hypothetical protein